MERMLRVAALAISGATILWLSGCGGGSDSGPKPAAEPSGIAAEIAARKAEREAAEAAELAAARQAENERLMNEAPSEITKDDFVKGSKITGSGILSTPLREGRRAGESIHLMNMKKQMDIHAVLNGYPESHEDFMKLIQDEWGLPMPELKEPYEYWYNAETHAILKRPKVQGAAERAAAESNGESE